jgi:IstB-like ATP binding protein
VVATALLDRLLHHATVIQIEGASYRSRAGKHPIEKCIQPAPIPQTLKRRGRPPKSGGLDQNDG